MTAREYVDELMLRLTRIEVTVAGSRADLLTYINRARREVQRITKALYPERYGSITTLTLTNTMYQRGTIDNAYQGKRLDVIEAALPDDFIDPWVVILMWVNSDGVTYRREARQYTKTEMSNINKIAWNVPSIWQPVYHVEFRRNAGAMEKVIYLASLNIGTTMTLFDISGGVQLEVWYIAALSDLEEYDIAGNTDTDTVIRGDLEELVIYYAMLYYLQQSREITKAQSVKAEIDAMQALLVQSYEGMKAQEEILLPSKEVGNA